MMEERLRAELDRLFAGAPEGRRTVELKEEILQNLVDKCRDLIAEGKSEESACRIALSGIGDIGELIAQLQRENQGAPGADADERYRRQGAWMTAVAVMLYIMCVIPVILFEDSLLAICLMFVMVAVATGLLIYHGMTKPKGRGKETVVDEFRQWQQSNADNARAYRAISSALTSVTVVVYLVVSFLTSAWHITWMIFLIAAALRSVIKAIFEMKG